MFASIQQQALDMRFSELPCATAGDFAGARASLQRAIALLPPLPATYIDLAIVFLRSGDLEKALGQFEAGLNVLNRRCLPCPTGTAAIADLREALAKKPDRADAHNMLGLLLGRKGAGTERGASRNFAKRFACAPISPQAYNNIGLVLTQADDDEAAIAAFREAMRISPTTQTRTPIWERR